MAGKWAQSHCVAHYPQFSWKCDLGCQHGPGAAGSEERLVTFSKVLSIWGVSLARGFELGGIRVAPCRTCVFSNVSSLFALQEPSYLVVVVTLESLP